MTQPEIPNLTQEELAKRWGVSQQALQKRHRLNHPMPPIADYLGRRPIRYRLVDVEKFENGETP